MAGGERYKVIKIDGEWRPLGCKGLPRQLPPGAEFPVFGSTGIGRLIPRSEWQECDWSHFIDEVLDQNGQGACNAFASVQALHVLRRMAGLPYVKLSAGNLYGRINGGVDRGSTLVDAIKELKARGVCTAKMVPELEWRPSRWPEGWEDEAKKFRVIEAWDCPSFDLL